jgi:hypothetical protein
MRRRQVWQQLVSNEEQISVYVPEPAKKMPKGHCRHCGKHIGRGIAFHEKRCAEINNGN